MATINAFRRGRDTTVVVHTHFIVAIYRLFQSLVIARVAGVG